VDVKENRFETVFVSFAPVTYRFVVWIRTA